MLSLSLSGKLDMYSAFEFARNRILYEVDILDSAKDLTDFLNHVSRVRRWEVHDLELGVQTGHHLRVLVNHLTLT